MTLVAYDICKKGKMTEKKHCSTMLAIIILIFNVQSNFFQFVGFVASLSHIVQLDWIRGICSEDFGEEQRGILPF